MPEKTKRNEPQTRWLEARIAERGITRKALSDHFQTYPNMIWRMLTGQRAMRPEELIEWSGLLDLSLVETFERFGFSPLKDTQYAPVIGKIKKRGMISKFQPRQIYNIESPAGELTALAVSTAQTELGLLDGAHVYYVPATIVTPGSIGRLCVLELGDFVAPVVGILESASAGSASVSLLGESDSVESDQLISAAPVRWWRL